MISALLVRPRRLPWEDSTSAHKRAGAPRNFDGKIALERDGSSVGNFRFRGLRFSGRRAGRNSLVARDWRRAYALMRPPVTFPRPAAGARLLPGVKTPGGPARLCERKIAFFVARVAAAPQFEGAYNGQLPIPRNRSNICVPR